MAETPLYSEHDIARYLEQKMSPQEMHAFEKALMDDPFLADALEGYSNSDHSLSQRHLAEIEEALAGNRNKTKVVPLLPVRKSGWKVAAAFVFIAGASLLSYLLLRPAAPEIPLAKLQKRDTGSVASIHTAPLASANTEVKKEATFDQREGPVTRQPVSKKPPRIYASAPPAPASVLPPTQSADVASNLSSLKMADSAMPGISIQSRAIKPPDELAARSPLAVREMRGRVMDSAGQPLAQATIIDNTTRRGTISDENGNFMLRVPDSVARVTVSSPGYSTATTSLATGQPPSGIKLMKNPVPLSEVVIVNGNAERKSAASLDASATAEPVGGWKNFRQYITLRIDSLQAKDSRNFYNNDDVVLEFSIDEKGNPVNIKAEAESNRVAADKAIEILAGGPKWKKKKKDKKVKVLIPFSSGK